MIFSNTKKMVDELATELNNANYPAAALHGDMKQEMRTAVMERFKEKKIAVLIATDVAARGIDVENVDMVINFDIPQELEYYVHRIGRTGRAGKSGVAITLATSLFHKSKNLRNARLKSSHCRQKKIFKPASQINCWSLSISGKIAPTKARRNS